MSIIYLPSFAYTRMRWRNQLGWTREIARDADDQDRERWRVSIAEIDHDSAYSAFPGLRREQVLLEGNGMTLTFADGRTETLKPPHGRIAFDGAEAPQCKLIEGPVRDFNLFFDPQQVDGELTHRPLVGTMLIFVEPRSTWLIYLMAGRMQVRSPVPQFHLDQGDSLRLDNHNDGRERLVLEGGGELLLIRLSPAAAA